VPRFGFVEQVTRGRVVGWAVDTDSLDRPAHLGIMVNGQPNGQVLADRPRDDAPLISLVKSHVQATAHASVTGRYGFEYAFDPPLSLLRDHRVVVTFADDGHELAQGSRALAAPPRGHMALTPILVTALGRSGTTMLMRYLSQHPAIVVADQYPYEIKFLSYYADAVRVLSSDADHERSDDPDAVLRDRTVIGFNPFNQRHLHRFMRTPNAIDEHFDQVVPTALLHTCGELVMDYYRRVQADMGKPNAVYIAEKAPPRPEIRDVVRLLAGSLRQILLVRDPRDILCSAKAFWKTEQTSAIQNIARLTGMLEALHRDAGEDTLLVRYEDMVMDPAATLAGVWRLLGLPALPRMTDLHPDLLARHVTTPSPSDSIGRWRRELSADDLRQCRQAFGGFMARYGYG